MVHSSTYYLLQMPGWSRRLRIMIDWTFGLLFRPDIVKVGLDSEMASLLREVVLSDTGRRQLDEPGAAAESGPLAALVDASQNDPDRGRAW